MRIIAKPLVVNEEDGFAKDKLGRQEFGESLCNLVIKVDDGLVLALDARWGEGKTTFVKMWQGLLRQKGIPSIYIDAFQDDYANDAFLTIAGHITQYAEKNSDVETAADFKKKATKVLLNVLTWSAKTGIKVATAGIIDNAGVELITSIKDDLSEEASKAAEKIFMEKLGSAQEDKAVVENFHTTLSTLPQKLRNNEGNRLVIILDELDRCRPTYAVNVLERIKHLFSVPNICFVLVMNKEQLEGTLKSVYGATLDARTYLQKFINIEATLPKKSDINNQQSDHATYVNLLYAAHEIHAGEDESSLITATTLLAQNFDLSLRHLERAFSNITLFYLLSDKNDFCFPYLLSFLSILKVIDSDLYMRLNENTIDYEQMMRELQSNFPRAQNGAKVAKIFDGIRFALLSEQDYLQLNSQDGATRFAGRFGVSGMDRNEIAPATFRKLNLLRSQS